MSERAPILHIATPEDFRAIQRAAITHKIHPIAPTHVLKRGEEVVGYGSAGQLALIAGWTADSVSDAHSLHAFRLVETAAVMHGAKFLMVVCTDDCRFKPFMQQEGYREGNRGTVYVKKVS